MTTLLTPTEEAPVPETVSETDFFENVPPGQRKIVSGLQFDPSTSPETWLQWHPADLHLFCTSEQCGGYRYFKTAAYSIIKRSVSNLFLHYNCKNCNSSHKQYAIALRHQSSGSVEIQKFGEFPQFGPPNPPKLMNLMGGERDSYLKGRRSENQGLGIGAFAYYRRVVETQKTKIIGEILKVAEKLNADPELISDLKAAQAETRFTEALKRIKHALPSVLLINGHNPLTLLHAALSEGLHAESDEQCLELATSIRIVLTDLVERMSVAVKEEAALTSAVQRLLQAGGKRKE